MGLVGATGLSRTPAQEKIRPSETQSKTTFKYLSIAGDLSQSLEREPCCGWLAVNLPTKIPLALRAELHTMESRKFLLLFKEQFFAACFHWRMDRQTMLAFWHQRAKNQ